MKRKLFFLLLPLIAAAWLTTPACRTEQEPPVMPPPDTARVLPPITMEGKNTFGCLLNDTIWLPEYDWRAAWDPTYRPLETYVDEQSLPNIIVGHITATESLELIRESIDINWPGHGIKLGKFYGVRSPTTTQDNFKKYFKATFIMSPNWYHLLDSDSLRNVLEITKLDTINNNISGTFEFKLYRKVGADGYDPADTIVIKSGRFDAKYFQ